VFDTSSDSRLAKDSRSEGSVPGVACTVHDGHFSCPSLGFRTTAQHRVVAGGMRTEVSLPVSGCRASAVTLSIRCPALPAGFYVEVPEPLRFREPMLAVNSGAGPQHQVEASYEGGATYPCVPEPDPVYKGAADATYFCPAAPGNEWGRGRYDILAVPSGSGERYVGSVSDPFDGCGGTGAPFQLTPEGARDNQ
jgi:hypothetical protein